MTRTARQPLHAPAAGDPTADAHTERAGACIGDHCITCSDEGIEMRVVALEGGGLARCAPLERGAPASNAEQSVETLLVEPLAPGDRVLVHAGVALALLGREPTISEPTMPEEPAR